jgi:uncharacterized spore protein YtfJ
MSDKLDKVIATAQKSQEQAARVVEKLFEVAQPSAVYGEPQVIGERTVITASEVSVGMGIGFGLGGGTDRGGRHTASESEPEVEGEDTGLGGGGGGGGGSMARPVAVISVGPEGVHVEPVVDPTKIALAFFTTLGSMFFMLSRMRRGR